jgi:hypothetical protein
MGKSSRSSVSFYKTNATYYNSKLGVSPRDTAQMLNFHNFTTWNNSSNYSSSFLQRKKSWDTALKCWPREKNPNPNLKIRASIYMPWCLNRGVSNKDIHKVAASSTAFVILTWPSHPPICGSWSPPCWDPAFKSGDELLEILTGLFS